MKNNIKPTLILIVCYLYVFLFIYAAFNKVLDFETFKGQLGQSPLLSAFAEWVAILVPAIEIIIAVLLIIPKSRYLGLLGAFLLMLMFSTYIIIILNYSSFIPCSCGGILSNMNWNEHLIFNISCLGLALIAILLFQRKTSNKNKMLYLLISSSISILLVVSLFLLSEEKMQRNNSFIRRYPHHPITELKGIPLDYNSYYIAGFNNGKIILGNNTAPLHVLSIDTALNDKKVIRIKITDSKEYPFKAVQLKIDPPFFYLFDGSIPIIYKGNTANWSAKTLTKYTTNFSLIEPINQDDFVVRSNIISSGEHTLGTIKKEYNYKLSENKNLLQKKIDGVFDTDGMLIYNKTLNKILYCYYYRNTFIVADVNLKTGKYEYTIDTISQAPMKFSYIKSNTEKKFSQQPTTINKYATTAGNYLFIKSDRLGKYELEEIAKQASIIDVYNLKKKTYEFSFYLYNYKNEEIKSFKIYNDLIIGLTNNYLIEARLKPKYFY